MMRGPGWNFGMPLPRLRMMKVEKPPVVRPQEGLHEPWLDKIYDKPPASKKDAWQLPQQTPKGWLVKCHGTARKQPFQPVHRGIPYAPVNLESLRVTKMFSSNGKVRIYQDEWSSQPEKWHMEDGERWTGYTFFKLKQSAGSPSATMAAVRQQIQSEGRPGSPSSMTVEIGKRALIEEEGTASSSAALVEAEGEPPWSGEDLSSRLGNWFYKKDDWGKPVWTHWRYADQATLMADPYVNVPLSSDTAFALGPILPAGSRRAWEALGYRQGGPIERGKKAIESMGTQWADADDEDKEPWIQVTES